MIDNKVTHSNTGFVDRRIKDIRSMSEFQYLALMNRLSEICNVMLCSAGKQTEKHGSMQDIPELTAPHTTHAKTSML